MNKTVIIVGSGLTGVHAAYPLVEAGIPVTMLDVGLAPEQQDPPTADTATFDAFRRNEPAQYMTFLGEDLSGLQPLIDSSGHANAMTSGRRGYVVRSSNELLPVESHDALVTQSLAEGGLSEAWGAVGAFLTQDELTRIGLPADMDAHYDRIIDRIGVSGKSSVHALQPPAELDANSEQVVKTYERKKGSFDAAGMTLEQPPLALLTEEHGSRHATQYRDMDFWNDAERARYRARYTLEELRRFSNFTYIPNQLVTAIKEHGAVTVTARDIHEHTEHSFEADEVILAAGAVNSTRILLNSFEAFDVPVPFIAKDHYLIACLVPSALGRIQKQRRHSLCQLTLTAEDTGMYAQLYSYRSLLLHKLLPYVPLPAPHALRALSALAPALMLVDVRFPSALDIDHYATLHKDGTTLEVVYPDKADKRMRGRELRRLKKTLRALGLIALSTVRNPYGATSHYAGGVPFSSSQTESYPLTVDDRGRLRQAKHIFVADSATWLGLPAKPPGFTLMANAERIGSYIRDQLVTGTT